MLSHPLLNILILIRENHPLLPHARSLAEALRSHTFQIDIHPDASSLGNYGLVWLIGPLPDEALRQTLETFPGRVIYQPDPSEDATSKQLLHHIYQHLDAQMQHRDHNPKIQLKLLFDQLDITALKAHLPPPPQTSPAIAPLRRNLDFYLGSAPEPYLLSQQQLLQPTLHLPPFPIPTVADSEAFRRLYPDSSPFILTTGELTPDGNLLGLCAALSDTAFPLLMIAAIRNREEQAYFDYCQMLSNQRLVRLDPLPESVWQAALYQSKLLVIPGFTAQTATLIAQAQTSGIHTVSHLPHLSECYTHTHWAFDLFNLTDLRQTVFQAWRNAQTSTVTLSSLLARYVQTLSDLCNLPTDSAVTTWDGQIKPWELTPDSPEQFKAGYVYTLTEQHIPALFNGGNTHLKSQVFLHAPTPLTAALLRKAGWHHVNSPMAREESPLNLKDVAKPVADAYSLDPNTLNLLTFYSPDNRDGWRESLKLYLDTFQTTDQSLLYLYIAAEQAVDENILEEEIVTAIEAYGHDPETIPDIHILISEHSLTEDMAFFQHMDVGLFFPTQYHATQEMSLKFLGLCKHTISDLPPVSTPPSERLLQIYQQKLSLRQAHNTYDCIYIHSLNHFTAYQHHFGSQTLALTDDINVFNALKTKEIKALVLIDHLLDAQYAENSILSQTITDKWADFFHTELQYKGVDAPRFCAYEMLYAFRGALNLNHIWHNLQQSYTIKSLSLPQELSRPQIWDTSDGPYPDTTIAILAYLAEQQQIPVHWLPPQPYHRRYHEVSQSAAHQSMTISPTPRPVIQQTPQAPIVLLGSITDYFEFSQVREQLEQQTDAIPFLFFNDIPTPSEKQQPSEISFPEIVSATPIPTDTQIKLQSAWVHFTQQRHQLGHAFIFANPYFEFQLKLFFSRIFHCYQVIDATHSLYQHYRPAIAIVGNLAEGYKSCRAATLKQLGVYVIHNTHGLIGATPYHQSEISQVANYIFCKNYLFKCALMKYMPTHISVVADLRVFKHTPPNTNHGSKPCLLWITSHANYGSSFCQAQPHLFLKNVGQLEAFVQSGEYEHIIKNHPLYDYHSLYHDIQNRHPQHVTTLAGEQSLEEVLQSYPIKAAILFNALSSSLIEVINRNIPTLVYGEALSQANLKNSTYPKDQPLFVNSWEELTGSLHRLLAEPAPVELMAPQILLHELVSSETEYASAQVCLQHINNVYEKYPDF